MDKVYKAIIALLILVLIITVGALLKERNKDHLITDMDAIHVGVNKQDGNIYIYTKDHSYQGKLEYFENHTSTKIYINYKLKLIK